MRRSVRSAAAVVAALLLPACNLTYVPDPGPTGGSDAPPFILVLPLDGELQAPTNPEFAWNALDGSTGYELQVSTAPDFSQIVWDDQSLTITSTFLTQVTLTNFTTYYWRIYGIQGDGTKVLAGGSPSQFRTQGGGFTIPTSFTIQFPTNNQSGVPVSPMFSWHPSMGATSYTIELDPAGTFTPPLIVQSSIYVNRVTLGVALSPGTTYSWRVLAIGQLGNTYSPPAMFTTGP